MYKILQLGLILCTFHDGVLLKVQSTYTIGIRGGGGFDGSHPNVSSNYYNEKVSVKHNYLFIVDWLHVSTL